MIEALAQQPWDLLFRLIIAALFSAVLGLERDIHGRAAGLRTHMLVGSGSAAFTIISIHISHFTPLLSEGFTGVADPGRIAAQVITGIGFLGAGAIIKEGFTIRGLTTAACLWVAAAIGMASGSGFYLIAVAVTAISLFSLTILNKFEKFLRKDIYRKLEISIPIEYDVTMLIDRVNRKNVKIIFFNSIRDYDNKITTAELSLRFSHKGNVDKLYHGMIQSIESSNIPLKSVKWSHI